MSLDKKYTAKEAALAVLKKCAEVLQKSEEQEKLPGKEIAQKEKDQTPPDKVELNSPDAAPKAGNAGNEPSLGEKVNAVVEQHMAEHGAKGEEKQEDNLKGHMKLAKFMGRMEHKRSGTQEDPKSEGEQPVGDLAKAMKLSSSHDKNAHLYSTDKGTSKLGHQVRSANRSKSWAKDPRSSGPSIERSMAKDKMAEAKTTAKTNVAAVKAAPKPNLTKAQKGVHEANHEGPGRSAAGSFASSAVKGNTSLPKDKLNSYAKDEHKAKLAELKGMPKPNLTKKETGHEKGVNTAVKAPGLKGGMSPAGLNARVSKEVGDHPVAKESMSIAKEAHKKTLGEIKAQPKPNLTKAVGDKTKEGLVVLKDAPKNPMKGTTVPKPKEKK